MSLINEALKKAQRQRNLEATPTASAASRSATAAVPTDMRNASHRGSKTFPWLGLGLLFLGAGVAAAIFFFFLNPALQPATTSPASSAQAIPPPKPEASPAVTATAPVARPTPVQPAPVPSPEPAVSLPAYVAPPAPPPSPTPDPVVGVTITQEARVYAVLDSLRITGVRGLGFEARVLMNEKIYRINDMVNRELGLRLSEVLPSLLVFTDATGGTYKKPL